jgi:hypothetical protein
MFSRILAASAALVILGDAAMAAGNSAAERNAPPPPSGLFQGTAQEQAACAPDATRFCMREIPDNLRVLGCLQENRRKLRKTCLNVLESHGM